MPRSSRRSKSRERRHSSRLRSVRRRRSKLHGNRNKSRIKRRTRNKSRRKRRTINRKQAGQWIWRKWTRPRRALREMEREINLRNAAVERLNIAYIRQQDEAARNRQARINP